MRRLKRSDSFCGREERGTKEGMERGWQWPGKGSKKQLVKCLKCPAKCKSAPGGDMGPTEAFSLGKVTERVAAH